MTEDGIFEAEQLAAAMKTWASYRNDWSGYLLVEGAYLIEKMLMDPRILGTMEAYAEEVRRDENEACAKICEDEEQQRILNMRDTSGNWPDSMVQGHKAVTAGLLAATIRDRQENEHLHHVGLHPRILEARVRDSLEMEVSLF